MSQLSLDGREVTVQESKALPRLGARQRDVLRLLAVMPGTTSSQLDELRPGMAAAARRLARRGLTERHAGLWFLPRGPFE